MRASILGSAFIAAVIAAIIKIQLAPIYNAFVSSDYHNRYFEGRIEYISMLGLSRLTKRILMHLPLISQHVRDHLREDVRRGSRPVSTNTSVYYDPAVHDRPYRSLKTNFLSREECAAIRGLLDRNIVHDEGTDFNESSLNMEFQSVSTFKLLGLEGDSEDEDYVDIDIEEEDGEILLGMLNRLQAVVEETFNTSTIMIEHSDVTRRSSPVPSGVGILRYLEQLHYLSTGGHGVHSDRCWFGSSEEDIFLDGFECVQTTEHCCAHRTHSVLLYLNDPDDDTLKGGDFYIVDRQDLDQESGEDSNEQIFTSEVGLAEHMRHTLRVKPSCGNLMLFASDTRNLHGTYPIESGVRYAMPMWFSDLSLLDVNERLLDEYLDRVWKLCPFMGGEGLPIPTKLKEYAGEDSDVYIEDCETFIEQVENYAEESIKRNGKLRPK